MKSLASKKIAFAFLLLASCTRPKSADLTGVPETYTPPVRPQFETVQPSAPPKANRAKVKFHQDANLQGAEATKMDILFVVDTSESMCSDQAALAKNINRFVDVFLKNKKVDFHIGVTAAWDSKLFGSAPRKFRNGELRPVTDGSGLRFVTNATKNLQQTLAKSLHIGFEPYLKNDPAKSGPESEELFSPMLAAFSQEMKDGPNKGFRRSDAHLAVVVVTDTEDATPDSLRPGQFMQAQEVIEQLNREVQSGTTLTVLAALARLDEMRQYQNRQEPGLTSFNQKFQNGSIKQCNSYTVDPGILGPLQGPYQIADLVRRAKGEAFDLVTKDFGSKMASLGRTLVSKALSYTINLDRVPDLSEDFQVSINGKVIPRDDAKGWSYNPDSQTVRLNEGLDLSGLDSFEVSIDFTIFE